jgi:hypothetical protein
MSLVPMVHIIAVRRGDDPEIKERQIPEAEALGVIAGLQKTFETVFVHRRWLAAPIRAVAHVG